MAQGPMSSILVTIRITVRIQESEIRIHWILAFGGPGGGLRSLSTSSYCYYYYNYAYYYYYYYYYNLSITLTFVVDIVSFRSSP